jgi:hypothetical protein
LATTEKIEEAEAKNANARWRPWLAPSKIYIGKEEGDRQSIEVEIELPALMSNQKADFVPQIPQARARRQITHGHHILSI